MKRSLENSIETSKKITNELPDLELSFEQIRKDEKLYVKSTELERPLIKAHDLLWDLKLALVGMPGKASMTESKKRRGRRPKKNNNNK